MIWLLFVVAIVALVGGIILVGAGASGYDKSPGMIAVGAVSLFFALIFAIMLAGSATVPATSMAIVENTRLGTLKTLGPGTHVWPFTPYLEPFVTKVTKYDLRDIAIEIGAQPVKELGIEAGSSSPGRPVVYYYARGWAKINPEKLIELHKRRGRDWADTWVEKVWVTALKNVQRVNPFDYSGTQPLQFTQEVEEGLQAELLDGDGVPIIYVSQLAIADYDYSDEVNSYLDKVAQLEFDQQAEVNRERVIQQQQRNKQIEADTEYNVRLRTAEAYRVETEEQAAADANALILTADAEAYAVAVLYAAESEGITLVQQALAHSPEAYLEYIMTQQWDGTLPRWWMPGEGSSLPVPFIDVDSP